MSARLLPLALLALLLGCPTVEAPPEEPQLPEGRFRVVLIADTHVIGPQYACCSESPGLDNASIVRTEERLLAVRDQINALRPRPEAVFVLGDVVHDAHVDPDPAFYDDEETAWSITADIFDGFEVPVHLVWGNHDYEVSCGGGESFEREFSHELFDRFFAAPTHQSVDIAGWRFLLMNSQLGPTWEPGHELCDTSMASYGSEQLAWADALLAEGLPTIGLFHYPLSLVTQHDEDPGADIPDLFELLDRYDNLVHTFAGHTHRWIDFGGTYGSPHTIVAATRYDTDNFWLLELDSNTGEYWIRDEDKAVWFSTCADTWVYDELQPAIDYAADELGDCGY